MIAIAFPLQVKNTFIEFDLRTRSHTRAESCPPLRKEERHVPAEEECLAKAGLKDVRDEMSYASTADSDDGDLRLGAETEFVADRSPSSESAGHLSSLWDFGLSASPTLDGFQSWQQGDYFIMSQHSTCATQAGLLRNPITTTMLRNIPQRFGREALVDNLINNGFGGAFDFLYMPNDFSTGINLGYAFINFVTEDVYMRFKCMFAGVKLAEESPKVCEVCDAKVQGKNANVDFYRDSTVMNMDEKYHPVVFENGVPQPFPRPTRPLGPVIWKAGSPKNAFRTQAWNGQFHGPRSRARRRDARYF